MKTNFMYPLVAICAIFLFGCEKEPDEPEITNEEEVITTLTYTLTPVGGGDVVVLQFKDLDGDGGNDPIITTDTLMADTMYTGVIQLLNETENPAEDITEEVREEDEEHQFFFESSTSGLSVAYKDQDADGKPVGIESTLTTGNAGTGILKVTLRHEPSKSAMGVSTGDITNAGGETDIEVSFPIIIQ